MTKYLFPIIVLTLILLVISAGCTISPPKSSQGSGTQGSGNTPQSSGRNVAGFVVKPTTSSTSNGNSITTTDSPAPLYKIGQLIMKSTGSTTGIAIVDYNSITHEYGIKTVIRNKKSSPDSGIYDWHTDGYRLVEWKNQTKFDEEYKYLQNIIIGSVINIPVYDPTDPNDFKSESEECDLVGDWRVNKGASIFMFRLDRIVVNKTGDQILIGTWDKVRTKEKRSFVIKWDYGPTPESADYMELITISSDYSKFTRIDNYGNKLPEGTWIGPVPSWKAELDKAKPDQQAKISSGTDCYKWIGGNEWYNKL